MLNIINLFGNNKTLEVQGIKLDSNSKFTNNISEDNNSFINLLNNLISNENDIQNINIETINIPINQLDNILESNNISDENKLNIAALKEAANIILNIQDIILNNPQYNENIKKISNMIGILTINIENGTDVNLVIRDFNINNNDGKKQVFDILRFKIGKQIDLNENLDKKIIIFPISNITDSKDKDDNFDDDETIINLDLNSFSNIVDIIQKQLPPEYKLIVLQSNINLVNTNENLLIDENKNSEFYQSEIKEKDNNIANLDNTFVKNSNRDNFAKNKISNLNEGKIVIPKELFNNKESVDINIESLDENIKSYTNSLENGNTIEFPKTDNIADINKFEQKINKINDLNKLEKLNIQNNITDTKTLTNNKEKQILEKENNYYFDEKINKSSIILEKNNNLFSKNENNSKFSNLDSPDNSDNHITKNNINNISGNKNENKDKINNFSSIISDNLVSNIEEKNESLDKLYNNDKKVGVNYQLENFVSDNISEEKYQNYSLSEKKADKMNILIENKAKTDISNNDKFNLNNKKAENYEEKINYKDKNIQYEKNIAKEENILNSNIFSKNDLLSKVKVVKVDYSIPEFSNSLTDRNLEINDNVPNNNFISLKNNTENKIILGDSKIENISTEKIGLEINQYNEEYIEKSSITNGQEYSPQNISDKKFESPNNKEVSAFDASLFQASTALNSKKKPETSFLNSESKKPVLEESKIYSFEQDNTNFNNSEIDLLVSNVKEIENNMDDKKNYSSLVNTNVKKIENEKESSNENNDDKNLIINNFADENKEENNQITSNMQFDKEENIENDRQIYYSTKNNDYNSKNSNSSNEKMFRKENDSNLGKVIDKQKVNIENIIFENNKDDNKDTEININDNSNKKFDFQRNESFDNNTEIHQLKNKEEVSSFDKELRNSFINNNSKNNNIEGRNYQEFNFEYKGKSDDQINTEENIEKSGNEVKKENNNKVDLINLKDIEEKETVEENVINKGYIRNEKKENNDFPKENQVTKENDILNLNKVLINKPIVNENYGMKDLKHEKIKDINSLIVNIKELDLSIDKNKNASSLIIQSKLPENLKDNFLENINLKDINIDNKYNGIEKNEYEVLNLKNVEITNNEEKIKIIEKNIKQIIDEIKDIVTNNESYEEKIFSKTNVLDKINLIKKNSAEELRNNLISLGETQKKQSEIFESNNNLYDAKEEILGSQILPESEEILKNLSKNNIERKEHKRNIINSNLEQKGEIIKIDNLKNELRNLKMDYSESNLNENKENFKYIGKNKHDEKTEYNFVTNEDDKEYKNSNLNLYDRDENNLANEKIIDNEKIELISHTKMELGKSIDNINQNQIENKYQELENYFNRDKLDIDKNIYTNNKREEEISYYKEKFSYNFDKEIEENVMKQIEKYGKIKLGKNFQEFKVELEPKELGKLHIKLTVMENKLLAQIGTENDSVKDILIKNINSLYKQLDANGLKLIEFNIFTTGTENASNSFSMFSNSWQDSQNGRKFFEKKNKMKNIEEVVEVTKIEMEEEKIISNSKINVVL